MSTYRWMRASDEDREQAAALLGDAFVAGRLTQDELDERCTAAYAAKTWGELDDLTADLPIVQEERDLPYRVITRYGPRPADYQPPFWSPLALALASGAALASLATSAVTWAGVLMIPLVLLLPLALRFTRRRRWHR